MASILSLLPSRLNKKQYKVGIMGKVFPKTDKSIAKTDKWFASGHHFQSSGSSHNSYGKWIRKGHEDVHRRLRNYYRLISPHPHSAATFVFVPLTLSFGCLSTLNSIWKNPPAWAVYSASDLPFSQDPAISISLGGIILHLQVISPHLAQAPGTSPNPTPICQRRGTEWLLEVVGLETCRPGLNQGEVSKAESCK